MHVGSQNTEKWLTSLSVKLSWTLRVKEVSGTSNSGASWLGSCYTDTTKSWLYIAYITMIIQCNTLYCCKMQCKQEDCFADMSLILTICRELERSCIKSSIVFSIGPLHKMWGNLHNINRILFYVGACVNLCHNNVHFLKLLSFFYKCCATDLSTMFVMYLSATRRIRLWIWLKYTNRNWAWLSNSASRASDLGWNEWYKKMQTSKLQLYMAIFIKLKKSWKKP